MFYVIIDMDFQLFYSKKGITQDFLFSYAQPEAQRSTASSQDSNTSLAVNHWINNIFYPWKALSLADYSDCLNLQGKQGGNSVYKAKQLRRKTSSILLCRTSSLSRYCCLMVMT